MDLVLPTTMTESRALIGMVQYYRDMWPRRSHILAPLTEAASSPKGRKYFDIMHYNSPLSICSILIIYWIVQTVRFLSLYKLMPLINSCVMLLVRRINIFHFYQKI